MHKLLLGTICCCFFFSSNSVFSQSASSQVLNDTLVYHRIHVDEKGRMLPWYSADAGESYDYVLGRVWHFWKNIETDSNGQKYYLNHQVWAPEHDKRGLGGDQLMMALSSWDLYYNYTGDSSLIENMYYMADYYLEHGLSPADAAWPNVPFPYNMNVESGIYDGDMILGRQFLQPDKVGSFALELVHLYKKTGKKKYLDASIRMANTLAQRVGRGDNERSPWPFKVNAITGDTGVLVNQAAWYEGMDKDVHKEAKSQEQKKSAYTSNWAATLTLFSELTTMKKGNVNAYKRAFDIAFRWMMEYPVKTNKWGPFFEDVPRWSDTQINATTFAMFLLEHPELDKNWKATVRGIIDWVYTTLGNQEYQRYGVTCVNEQTAYRVPGNSHSARQASVDLMYGEQTGDTSLTANAIRELHWATYMVDDDGKNFYPTNAVWMTDGYGDYVRHYLRAMAAMPELAPQQHDHLLRSSSIITSIKYNPDQIIYSVYDASSRETLRLTSKPALVRAGGKKLLESSEVTKEGWTWHPLEKGGVVVITHRGAKQVSISK